MALQNPQYVTYDEMKLINRCKQSRTKKRKKFASFIDVWRKRNQFQFVHKTAATRCQGKQRAARSNRLTECITLN